MKLSSILAAVLILAGSVPQARSQTVGTPFPRLEFPLLGEPDLRLDLGHFAGKKVLLVQFASW